MKENENENEDKEINDIDLQEITRLIQDGVTSGILDSEGWRISWKLEMYKFEN